MIRLSFILLLLALGLIACGGSSEEPTDRNPEVTITSATTSNTASYTLTATATDDVGVSTLSYTLNGNAPEPIDPVVSPLSAQLTLDIGDNTIVVSAEDADGNEGSDQITVNYDPSNPNPEETGALELTISGLPAGEEADVTVLVPGVYVQDVSETTTLEDLSPDDYTVEARDVTTGSGAVYVANPPHKQVLVEANQTAQVEIAYKLRNADAGGSLAVTINGLPAGEAADVTVSSSGGFDQILTESFTFVDLAAGDYTITASEVTIDGNLYTPNPETQTVTVEYGQTTNATVSYSGPETGSLELSISGLPLNVAADVKLTDTNGFSKTITEDELLTDLEPGVYSLEADAVQDGSDSYLPSESAQQVTVTAGQTTLASVAYEKEDANTGSLSLFISGLKEGAQADVTVTKNDGSQEQVSSSTTLHNLPAGDYTIEAAEVAPDSATFSPDTLSQTVEIRVGETTQADVDYTCATVKPPDFGLEAALRDELNISSGPVSCAAVETLTELNADGYDISDPKLEGLQYAVNVQELYLGYNELSELADGVFSALINLQVLDLGNNAFTTLPSGAFSGLTGLLELTLEDNPLTTLPEDVFSELTELQYLYIDDTTLTTLPSGLFSGLTKLESLDLYRNQLAKLPDSLFSDLPNLLTLDLSGNQLTTLTSGTFSGLSSVTELDLEDNLLSETLPANVFSSLTSLQNLDLDNNAFTTLPQGLFSGLKNLQDLDLYGNQLSTLPSGIFAGLTALNTLSLRNNEFTKLPAGRFSDLKNLQTLWLSGNQFTSLSAEWFSGLANLQVLRIENNQLNTLALEWFAELKTLQSLHLENNCLEPDKVPVQGILSDLSVPNIYTTGNPRTDLTCPPVPATLSTFSNSDEGWTVSGEVPAWNSSGYVTADDSMTGNFWEAPSIYYGDAEDYYGRTLNFDLRQTPAGTFALQDVVLSGNGSTLYKTLPSIPTTTRTSYTLELAAGSGWVDVNENPVSEADIREVLRDLTSLKIRWDYGSGGEGDLDNVVFGAE